MQRQMKGVYDPGHGGKYRGAVASNGVTEASINLEFAKRLTNLMRAEGHSILMTRDHDNHLHPDLSTDLSRRAAIANGCGANYFLSIHCNAHEGNKAHGFEIWTSPGDTKADPLATAIYRSVEATMPELKLRHDFVDGDPDKESKLKVLMETAMPAALIELAFMSNDDDLKLLMSRDFQIRLALAIGLGVRAWEKAL